MPSQTCKQREVRIGNRVWGYTMAYLSSALSRNIMIASYFDPIIRASGLEYSG